MNIKRCISHSDFSLAIRITRDYMDWLNMDLGFQDIEKELERFSFMYGHPNGIFLLAWDNSELVGGVGFRLFQPTVCEMKRLFVYDRYKGGGVGRSLCEALISEAKDQGYEKMRLDTLDRLTAATALYRSLGFREIGPYRYNPDPTAIYMELDLKTIETQKRFHPFQ